MKMGRQSKWKKPESVGQGNVTPVQIAFIVDRYLSDNNYTQTRSAFHSEAHSLISKFSVKEVPNSVMSLGAILDEYISLKGRRVFLDQERVRLEQENLRIQNLLKGMHDAMSAYNASANTHSSLPASAATVPHVDPKVSSTPGYYPVYKTPIVLTSGPLATQTDAANFSTPVMNQASSKRRGSKDVLDGPSIAKRSRKSSNTKQLPPKGGVHESIQKSSVVQPSSNHDNELNGSPVQGCGVAKCLFNQATKSPPTNSSSPKTPPRASSSQTDKSISPVEVCSTVTSGKDVTPQQITSTTNSTIISSQLICISPAKQIAYCSIERNHLVSISSPAKTSLMRPSQRDHVKGRLNFDASDMPNSSENPVTDGVPTSESDREGEIFDLDLDALGMDFNLSELLLDFDIQNDGVGTSGQVAADSSPDVSGSPHTSENFNVVGDNQVVSRCSTLTEVLSEKDMDTPGPDTVTTIKSVTKCIKILSPAKSQR